MRTGLRARGRAVGALLSVTLAVGVIPALGGGEAAAAVPAAPRGAETAPADGGVSEADALAEARRTGKPVEISARRGESREVFATPEGNLEAREYLRPVWARGQGGWKPVDTSLVAAGEGMVAPRAATVEVEFSAGGGSVPLVRMRRAGRELSLSWPAALPKPQLEGAVATYASVLPDVDLRMTAQEDGFTQLLVVKSAKAAESAELAELRLKLSASGLDVRETAGGGLEAIDKGAAGAVFEAPKPMMWDSSPGEQPATPAQARAATSAAQTDTVQADGEREPGAGESGKLAPVDVAVTARQDELVLTPDADVLKGADTTYPVYIDPQWSTPKASAWTMASKYWASSPQWKFNGASDAGLGYCNWDYCAPHDTKRLFYRIPTSTFAGKSILSAEFVVRNTWSASCSARNVELWQTKDISSSTTWNSQNASGFWIKQLASIPFAYGYTGCAAKDAEFDVKSAVQTAANNKSATMTFGLQAASETDGYAWKRFSDKAYLHVKYNRPPPQIKTSQLTMEYGGTCKKPADAAHVRTLGKIYANSVTDPDGDNVAVQFQASWDTGDGKGLTPRWKPALTSYKKSGSSFYISLPTSIPQNKQINWEARSYDGAQYSPWSSAGDPAACYFSYDTKVPKAPVITSGDYPAFNPEDPDDPWYDGVGKYGTFSIKGADTDVTKYWYGVNSEPTSKNTLTTTGGAAKTIRMLPAKPGMNFIIAQAFDQAGNAGEPYTYQFQVKTGQPERAMWQMDEDAGASQAAGSAPARTLELRGGAAPGVPGAKGTAVSFNGVDGYAISDIPTVDTSSGFSVSAWAKLSTMPSQAAIVAAQPGNRYPGFELYYSQTYDRWVFNQYKADAAGAGLVRAMAPSPGGAKAGQWTHLVGTYSLTDKELKLYVDGALVGTTAYTTPWDARRGLQIGAGSYSGKPDCFFPGAIDEVQIFDRPLSAGEVTRLHSKESPTSGRPARTVFPMDEPAGATQLTGKAEVPPAKFFGGVTSGQAGVAGNALRADGSTGYAATDRPLLNTARSYTVSAWAKLPTEATNRNRTVLSQSGTYYSPFYLSYEWEPNTWSLRTSLEDVEAGNLTNQRVRANQPARPGEWTHLVAVHDADAQQIRLYVNGQLQGSAAAPKIWEAQGPVQVGRAIWTGKYVDYFLGEIDDVRFFDRPVADDEARQMFQQRPQVKARWTFEETAGTSPVTTPNAVSGGSALTLNGGAKKSDFAFIDFGSLELDGVGGYAATTSVPVDTSGSYTVTAWAQAAALPTRAVALVSAEGSTQSALTVRFVPDTVNPEGLGHWELAVPDKDDTDATVVRVKNSEFYDARDWNHLAVVYDGFAKQTRLYVNGALQELSCDGNGENCGDQVSSAENTFAFKAAKSFQVGRAKTDGAWGEYFPGLVDDVWAFQGVLTDEQVQKLAASWFDVPTEVPSTG
ncbi:LamG-like jellyroll fold domain-containing protein [Streptomyces sp. NPDC091412]|uniref:LamG-like jellyroll fold domain-containing protein n=1 Tax=Streptomyces sp. NPDC091412 TaxID=3366002 RepID=UPI0037F40B09